MIRLLIFISFFSIGSMINVFTGSPADAGENKKSQTVIQAGSQQPFKGPEKYFTGDVLVEPVYPAADESDASGAYVTFKPEARSAWHTHPAGQRLIITSGTCRTQEEGGTVTDVSAGGSVWCPPGVKHWHGASPEAAMTHLSIAKAVAGGSVEWMEKVNDEQYYGNKKIPIAKDAKKAGAALSPAQEKTSTIAAFTARGDIAKLKNALNEGLNAGLSINEIKEILIQMYAYAGFPRSLNGLNAFIEVLRERKEKGLEDKTGKEASPLPADKTSLELGTDIQTKLIGEPAKGAYITFAPAIDKFLKGHLFGDIFGRDILDFQSREIATIGALSGMSGVEPQLQGHFSVGLNTGLTEEQLRCLIS